MRLAVKRMYLKMAMAAWHQEGWSIVERSGHYGAAGCADENPKSVIANGGKQAEIAG